MTKSVDLMKTLEEFLREQMAKGLSAFRVRAFLSDNQLGFDIDNPSVGALGGSARFGVRGDAVECVIDQAPTQIKLNGGWKTERVTLQGGKAIITVGPMGR